MSAKILLFKQPKQEPTALEVGLAFSTLGLVFMVTCIGFAALSIAGLVAAVHHELLK